MNKGVRTLIGVGCAYEVFALTTGKVPTLSKICKQYRVFEGALLGALLMHFHYEKKVKC